jgi:hypothetical protein
MLQSCSQRTFSSAHTFQPFPNPLLTSPGGGMGTSRNRTTWPVNGGALAVQPGWFQGHATGLFYVNLGFGTDGPDNGPMNFSNPMVPVFQFTGPSNGPYPGTFCLPQIPLPLNASVKAGDLATIQVVMAAVHGASLYNVSLYYPRNWHKKQPLTGISASTSSSQIQRTWQRSTNQTVSIALTSASTMSSRPRFPAPTYR